MGVEGVKKSYCRTAGDKLYLTATLCSSLLASPPLQLRWKAVKYIA